jgi:hypothetical protein
VEVLLRMTRTIVMAMEVRMVLGRFGTTQTVLDLGDIMRQHGRQVVTVGLSKAHSVKIIGGDTSMTLF